MDRKYLNKHISEQFNQELDNLLKMLNKMGKHVLDQFENILISIEEKDIDYAKQALRREKKITAYDQEIHELCYQIMAIRNPVARDLRAVLSTLQTTTDLDRISDEIARVAKVLKNKGKIDKVVIRILLNYGTEVFDHFQNVLKSLETLDIALVSKNILKKKAMNTLYLETVQNTMHLEEKLNVDEFTSYLFIIKSFETIFKHSRNISKNVIFYEEGVDVRHQPNREIINQLNQ